MEGEEGPLGGSETEDTVEAVANSEEDEEVLLTSGRFSLGERFLDFGDRGLKDDEEEEVSAVAEADEEEELFCLKTLFPIFLLFFVSVCCGSFLGCHKGEKMRPVCLWRGVKWAFC